MMAVILLIMAMITLRHFTLITKLICASTFTVKATTFTHSRTSLSLTNLVNKASKAAEQVLRCDNHLNQVALPTFVVHQVGDWLISDRATITWTRSPSPASLSTKGQRTLSNSVQSLPGIHLCKADWMIYIGLIWYESCFHTLISWWFSMTHGWFGRAHLIKFLLLSNLNSISSLAPNPWKWFN